MPKKRLDYASLFTLRKDGLYMGYWHDDNGKRHAMYDRDPEKLLRRVEEAETKTKSAPTFRSIAEEWERKHFDRIGFKTAEAYKAPLRRLIERYGEDDVADVTPQRVYAYLLELAKRGYSRRSVQMHRDIVNMIYNNAIVDGKAQINPCASISLPRNLPSSKRTLPDDEAIRAVREKTDHPFALFALICLYAGLRRGEALALRYEDIDRKNSVIHVTKAVEYIGNSPHIKPPKTEAGIRDAALLAPLADALPKRGRGLIFANSDGTPLTKTQYRKRWLSYCQYIGCDITAHQLRHGFATILYEAGVPDKDAQELMGHSNISVTRDIYTHIRQSRRDSTVSQLNDFLKNAPR
jgi:integrase